MIDRAWPSPPGVPATWVQKESENGHGVPLIQREE